MLPTPRGLATVALLKTRFDEGRDHLGLFEPFVLDGVAHASSADFVAADIRMLVQERSGLNIPVDTVQTLLGRIAKSGLLSREGGRYLRTSKALPDQRLDEARLAAELSQHLLAAALLAFGRDQHVDLSTAEDALAALSAFITENKVPLVLSEPLPESPLERSSLPTRTARVIARFVTQRCFAAPDLKAALEQLVEGLILRDTLLLGDLAAASQRFAGLVVALDTPVLFAALDMAGVATAIATREGLSLLRDTGATTIAFDRTIAEMRRVLTLYENKIATAEGRLSLYPTPVARYFLTTGKTPAEIRMVSATLEKRLAAIGIAVRETPKHDRRYTLNEERLAESLVDPADNKTDTPRIRHDVDCVAGVLTLRAGRAATMLERSHAIFCTTSGRVVHNVQGWYRGEDEAGVPPIVHQLALTNIAWLKHPAAARGLKMHELSALCAAALRPTRRTWQKFMDNLKQLRAEGVLSDDETVAVVASELTEPVLAGLDDEFEPDADTMREAIERVRRTYQDEAERAASQAVQFAQSETILAQQSASAADARVNVLVQAVESRVQRVARVVSMAFYLLAALGLLVAAALSVPGAFESMPQPWAWTARGVLGAAAVFGVYGSMHGRTVADVRERLQRWCADRIRVAILGDVDKRLAPPDDGGPTSDGTHDGAA